MRCIVRRIPRNVGEVNFDSLADDDLFDDRLNDCSLLLKGERAPAAVQVACA